MKYKHVIFVCTGNTCRSPMAEGLFNHLYKDKNIRATSAGLLVFNPDPANALAVKVMSEKGIDITAHRSAPFDKNKSDAQTLVLTMTDSHKTVISQHGYPYEVYTIKEYVGSYGDVADPYGGDINMYQRCSNELEKLIDDLGGKL